MSKKDYVRKSQTDDAGNSEPESTSKMVLRPCQRVFYHNSYNARPINKALKNSVDVPCSSSGRQAHVSDINKTAQEKEEDVTLSKCLQELEEKGSNETSIQSEYEEGAADEESNLNEQFHNAMSEDNDSGKSDQSMISTTGDKDSVDITCSSSGSQAVSQSNSLVCEITPAHVPDINKIDQEKEEDVTLNKCLQELEEKRSNETSIQSEYKEGAADEESNLIEQFHNAMSEDNDSDKSNQSMISTTGDKDSVDITCSSSGSQAASQSNSLVCEITPAHVPDINKIDQEKEEDVTLNKCLQELKEEGSDETSIQSEYKEGAADEVSNLNEQFHNAMSENIDSDKSDQSMISTTGDKDSVDITCSSSGSQAASHSYSLVCEKTPGHVSDINKIAQEKEEDVTLSKCLQELEEKGSNETSIQSEYEEGAADEESNLNEQFHNAMSEDNDSGKSDQSMISTTEDKDSNEDLIRDDNNIECQLEETVVDHGNFPQKLSFDGNNSFMESRPTKSNTECNDLNLLEHQPIDNYPCKKMQVQESVSKENSSTLKVEFDESITMGVRVSSDHNQKLLPVQPTKDEETLIEQLKEFEGFDFLPLSAGLYGFEDYDINEFEALLETTKMNSPQKNVPKKKEGTTILTVVDKLVELKKKNSKDDNEDCTSKN